MGSQFTTVHKLIHTLGNFTNTIHVLEGMLLADNWRDGENMHRSSWIWSMPLYNIMLVSQIECTQLNKRTVTDKIQVITNRLITICCIYVHITSNSDTKGYTQSSFNFLGGRSAFASRQYVSTSSFGMYMVMGLPFKYILTYPSSKKKSNIFSEQQII